MAESTKPTHATLAVVFQVRSAKAAGAALEARERILAGRLVPPGRLPRRRARRSRSRSGGTWPRRSTSASSPTSSSSRRRSEPERPPARVAARDGATSDVVPLGVDPGAARRHGLAPRRPSAEARVRPPRDHAGGPRAASGEALVHEHRLRARAGDVHDRASCATSTPLRSATICRRRTSSGCSFAAECSSRPASAEAPAAAGGRPAALFRFSTPKLEVTDQFAVLRPPER